MAIDYKPFNFFLSSLCISATFWLIAAYISYYHENMQYLLFPLIITGMSGPTIALFTLMITSRNKGLWSDFVQRLRFNRIKFTFLPILILLMPCVVLLSITISLFFGLSPEQFVISAPSDEALSGIGILAIAIIVFLSCSLEEMGWRGYGIDSLLHSNYNLWETSLLFATIWSLWHIPAFFIKNGYFQQELWNPGFMYVIVYFISLFPITIIINWLYIENNRSILIAIFFHMIMNLSYGLFKIELLTKIIVMLQLLIIAGIIVLKNKALFLKRISDDTTKDAQI